MVVLVVLVFVGGGGKDKSRLPRRPRTTVCHVIYIGIYHIGWHSPETVPISLAVGMILSKSEHRACPSQITSARRQGRALREIRTGSLSRNSRSPARTGQCVIRVLTARIGLLSIRTHFKAVDSPGLGCVVVRTFGQSSFPMALARWSTGAGAWNDPTSPAQS